MRPRNGFRFKYFNNISTGFEYLKLTSIMSYNVTVQWADFGKILFELIDFY